MKKFIALLLAMMLVLGSTSALALDTSRGMEVEASLNVNMDGLTQLLNMTGAMNSSDAPSPELLKAVTDLIGLISVSAKVGNNGGQMTLNLNKTSLVSAQLDTTADGGLAVTTDVLPSFAFVVDGRTMNMLNSQLSSMVTGSPEQIAKAAEKLMAGLAEVVADEYAHMKTTLINSGNTSYTYENVNFNYVEVKSLAEVDAAEAVRNLCIRAIDLATAFVNEAGIALPVMGELTEAREYLNGVNVYENNYSSRTSIKITEYKVMEGGIPKQDYGYTVFEIGTGYETYYISLAMMGKAMDAMLCYGVGEQYSNPLMIMMAANRGDYNAAVVELSLAQGNVPEEVNASMGMISGGVKMNVIAESKPDGKGGMNMKLDYYMMNATAPLLTVNYRISPLAAPIVSANIAGRQQINLMELANGYMDRSLENALMQEAQNSLSGLLIKAITAAPDQIQLLMNEVTNMMNQPAYYY